LLRKNGDGQLTLNTAASTHSTGATTLNDGTLKIGVGKGATYDALGTTGAILMNGGTLWLAADAPLAAHTANQVLGDSTVILDRASGGAGITHTLGTLTALGTCRLTVLGGTNVTSGRRG